MILESNGRELTFLPGASGSTKFWQPVMEKLPEQWSKKVIFYPGFSEYEPHPEVQSFQDLQNHVLSQIVEPIVLIAQSMGGIFTVQAALEKPNLIKALLLIATSGGVDLSTFQMENWRLEYQKQFNVPDWFVGNDTKLDARLHEIQCPVLLIWGDADPISPVAVGEYLASKLKYSTSKIVKDGQHD